MRNAGSRGQPQQQTDVLTILEGVHGKVEAQQASTQETAPKARDCMQSMLRALVLPQ